MAVCVSENGSCASSPGGEGVIPSHAKIRLDRLGHINVCHNFATFFILRLFLDFSLLNIKINPLVPDAHYSER